MVDFKNLAWATSFATRASRKFIYLPYRASGKKKLLSYPVRWSYSAYPPDVLLFRALCPVSSTVPTRTFFFSQHFFANCFLQAFTTSPTHTMSVEIIQVYTHTTKTVLRHSGEQMTVYNSRWHRPPLAFWLRRRREWQSWGCAQAGVPSNEGRQGLGERSDPALQRQTLACEVGTL